MIPSSNPQSAIALRTALCAILLLVSAFAMYRLSLRFMGQIHHHGAEALMRAGYHGLALARLNKAVDKIPGDPGVHRSLGQIHLKLGALKRSPGLAINQARQSQDAYMRAAELNPLDAQAAYGMAKAVNRLDEIKRYGHPETKGVSYDPDPHFKEAIRLRPNGILYRYAYARYLARTGRLDELASTVQKLAYTYPPSYHYIRKEPFWSPPVKEACRKGLEAAIAENVSPRAARLAVSSMLARDREWAAAIEQYKAALTHKAFDNKAGDYVRLGCLYMENGEYDEARSCFFRALSMSRNRDQLMTQLYQLYRRQKQSEKFEAFFREADRTFILPQGAQILLARTLMDLKQNYQARRILSEMVQKRPSAEGYYRLARIAQADKDWDGMELAGQKATVLEPENSTYHLIFSQALKQMKKLERAEKEADLALKYEKKPSPWSLNHRAWIRWARKDYPGSLKDWIKAIGLKSDSASLYAHAAEAHVKLGHVSAALEYYKKAVKLGPGNARYGERMRKIQTSNIQH